MPKLSELHIKIEGMHCAACVSNVENTLKKNEGVVNCQVNLATHSARVEYKNDKIDQSSIIEIIAELGYRAEEGTPDILTSNRKEHAAAKSSFILSLSITIPLMLIAMMPMVFGAYVFGKTINGLLQMMLSGMVLFYAGRDIIIDAFRQAKHARTNMNSLIAMGTLTAFFWSIYALVKIFSGENELLYFDSSAMIISLILLGRYLEAKSKGKAGEAIKALLNLTPPKALALINNVELEIDTAVIKPDMILIVRPGERIPADGEIIEGKPNVDESMITGESLPVEKKENLLVYGGSLNGNIPFKMKVTASGDKTFLASIIRLVTEAQSKKAPVQKLADKAA